jgi:hypothetical protein
MRAYFEKHPGGAAGGWNLVCVTLNPRRAYLGFGLRPINNPRAPVQAYTSAEVSDILQAYHDANPSAEELQAKQGKATAFRSMDVDSDTLGRVLAFKKDSSGSSASAVDKPALTAGGVKRLSQDRLRTLLTTRFDEK